jgi:hypothetical protein
MEKEIEYSGPSNGRSRSENELQERPQTIDSPKASLAPEQENDIGKERDDQEGDDIEHVLTWKRTHESQHSRILGLKSKDERAMISSSKMGGGKPYPPELRGLESDYVVEFDGPDDPTHPQNWPTATKSVPSLPLE